jgi:hypothetical protein
VPLLDNPALQSRDQETTTRIETPRAGPSRVWRRGRRSWHHQDRVSERKQSKQGKERASDRREAEPEPNVGQAQEYCQTDNS